MKSKSVLRYPGGKSLMAKSLVNHFPKDMKEYRELFLGGGSVFFQLRKHNKIPSILNDINTNLYCFWYTLINSNEDLIKEILRLKEKYKSGKELFLKCKKELFNPDSNSLIKASRYFILSRIGFNGIALNSGYSEKSFKDHFTIKSILKIREYKSPFINTQLFNQDYSELLEDHLGIFYYFDPPYTNNKLSNLYGKNGGLHRNFDHKKFFYLVEQLKRAKWIMTINYSEAIKERFSFCYVYENLTKHQINSKHQLVKELLISNMRLRIKKPLPLDNFIFNNYK